MPNELLTEEPQSQSDNLTPEERLLKVIRLGAGAVPRTPKPRKREVFFDRLPEGLKNFIITARIKTLPWVEEKAKWIQSRWKANKGFTTVLVLLVVLFLTDQIVQRVNQMPVPGGAAPILNNYPVAASNNPAPAYVNPSAPAAATGWTQAPVGNKSFRLVGITWNEKGFTAMIEIAGENSAHFVRKGDEVTRDVKVKEIKQFSVVLSSRGREWELN